MNPSSLAVTALTLALGAHPGPVPSPPQREDRAIVRRRGGSPPGRRGEAGLPMSPRVARLKPKWRRLWQRKAAVYGPAAAWRIVRRRWKGRR